MAEFVREIRGLSGVEAAWLIGSRASGQATPSSDWAILLFGTESAIEELASKWQPEVADVDLLIVYDGENFRSPWPRPDTGRFKRGSLPSWEWREIRSDEAVYKQSKPIGEHDLDISETRAILLFRNERGAV